MSQLTLNGDVSNYVAVATPATISASYTITLPTAVAGTNGSILTSTTAGVASWTATLPVANGGTGITSFGSGVATWLGTPSSANLAAAVTDETGSGSLVFGTAPTLTTPTITNYIETPYTATVAGTVTIALTNGTFQILTMTTATNLAVTMPTTPTPVAGQSFILVLKQPASGTANSVTWTTVKWSGGTTPTVTATVGKADIFTFIYDGTNWYGSYVQNYTY